MRWAIAVGALWLATCRPAEPPPPPCLQLPAPEGEAVARVGDTPIVVEQIAERMLAYRAVGFHAFLVESPAPYAAETMESLIP